MTYPLNYLASRLRKLFIYLFERLKSCLLQRWKNILLILKPIDEFKENMSYTTNSYIATLKFFFKRKKKKSHYQTIYIRDKTALSVHSDLNLHCP